MKRFIWVTAAVMAFAGTASAKGEKPKEASAKERQQIQKIADDYEKAFNKQDVQQMTQLFTADATLITPMGQSEGREEIQQNLQRDAQGAMKQAQVDVQTNTVTMLSPTMALVDGTNNITGAQDPQLNGSAKFVAVATKQGNQWKVQALRAFRDPQQGQQQGVGGAGTEGATDPSLQGDPSLDPEPVMEEPMPSEPAPQQTR